MLPSVTAMALDRSECESSDLNRTRIRNYLTYRQQPLPALASKQLAHRWHILKSGWELS